MVLVRMNSSSPFACLYHAKKIELTLYSCPSSNLNSKYIAKPMTATDGLAETLDPNYISTSIVDTWN